MGQHTPVRSHTRSTISGPVRVRAHGRKVSWADRMASTSRRSGSEVAPALSAMLLAAFLLLVWMLTAVLSLAAAILCAVASLALAFLAWQIRPTPKRRRSRPKSITWKRRRKLAWYRTRRKVAARVKTGSRTVRQLPAKRQATKAQPTQERKAG